MNELLMSVYSCIHSCKTHLVKLPTFLHKYYVESRLEVNIVTGSGIYGLLEITHSSVLR